MRKKKQAENMNEPGEGYRFLFESNPHPMWVYDLETLSFLAVNDAAVHHYGYSREEFLGMTIKDIRPQEDIPALLDNVSRVTEGLDAAGIWRHRKKDGSIIYVEITSHTLTFAGRRTEIVMANDVTERWRWEERLEKLNRCFLGFGPDPVGNINSLTALCGELMGAASALYNRLDKGMLCSWGLWNPPPGYNPVDKPDGHICYDTIRRGCDDVQIIRDLNKTLYARTDPNVKAYKLRTYIGRAVKFGGDYVGSLCVVYQNEFIPTEDDKRLMELIASAIGVEENRKGAKEALRQSKEFAETVLNSINDAISIIDVHNFRIIDTNRAFLELYGLKKEGVVGKHCYEISHKKLQPCVPPDDSCPLQETLKTGEHSTVEHVHYLRDGKTHNIEVSASPIRNETGEIIRVVHVARDITERKRAEEKLQLFRNLIDRSNDSIFVNDPETGRILDANDKACANLGYTREDLLNMYVFDIEEIMPDHFSWKEHAKEIMEKGYLILEGLYRRKDGTVFPVEVNVNSIALGKNEYMVAVARDVTERKQAESALKESEMRFRSVVQSANDAIILTDSNWNIIFWNKGAEAIFGYAENEMLGKPAMHIIMPERYRTSHQRVLEHVRLTGKSEVIGKTVEFIGLRKNNNEFPLEISIATWKTEKDTFYSAIIRDITERKQAEKLLEENIRAELYGFIVSALPVFASGVPSQVRNILVRNFAERFERNIRPRFEEETKHLSLHTGRGIHNEFDVFMLWLAGLFSNLGIKTRTAPGEVKCFELLNCPWKGEASGNPIFCLICRTIVMRSLTWTLLNGWVEQKSSIANGSRTCMFEINIKSIS